MRWLVAISVVRAGKETVPPGAAFLASVEIGDELVALEAAREARPDEVPAADPTPAPASTPLADLPVLAPLRMAAIGAVVATLEDGDWKPTGFPKTDVLTSRLGWKPKGTEILRFKRAA